MSPPPAAVQLPTEATPEFSDRAQQVVRLLGGDGDYATLFSPAFKVAVSEAKLTAINARLATALGQPTGIESIKAITPWAAQLRIEFERGTLNAEMAVDPAAPHTVTGLRLLGAVPRSNTAGSIAAVIEQLKAFPGSTVFALAQLGVAAPVTTTAHNATTPIAIGSAFKLVILAELVRSIEAGERKWSDVVTLDGSARPGGGYAQQPRGTRIALKELAGRMISVSDNSATDILLFHLGRAKVEAMLPVVGFTDGGARNVPFLGALELFKLKGGDGGTLGTRYLSLDRAARRAFLDGPVRNAPIAAIPRDLFQNGKPLRIAELEWFASPNDLIRAMDWLRRHMDGPAGNELRTVLSKNPGIAEATTHWRYVGYKGGSEPGVLTMVFLLQAKDGSWHALAAGVNDTAQEVDTLKFTGLMARTLNLAAPR